MPFEQACMRFGLLFLALSLQAVSLRAEDALTKAAPAPVASPPSTPVPQARQAPPDPSGLQSQAFLASIDKILKRAATARETAKTLPARDKFLFEPVWTETREEREKEIRDLLDGALAVVTDAPILKLQEDIRKQQEGIAADRERMATLREKRLEVPQSGLLPSFFSETKESIEKSMTALEADIKKREADILRIKQEIGKGLAAAGVTLSQDQLDLLLDGVLGDDILKLMTAFEVAKVADQKLATLVKQSSEDSEIGAPLLRHARGAFRYAGSGPGHADRAHRQGLSNATERDHRQHRPYGRENTRTFAIGRPGRPAQVP